MIRVRVLLLLLCFTLAANAQKKERIYNPQDEYVYKNEFSGGLRLQSNGISLLLEYGKIKDIKRTRLFQVDYQYYIDFKMKKQKAFPLGKNEGRNYFYGLQNKFHMLRFSYGGKRMIADKARRNGVRVSFVGYGGITLGLLVPYKLDLKYDDDKGNIVVRSESYSEANKEVFLDRLRINEASGVGSGFGKTEPVPGLHGKVGFDFDFGGRDEYEKALGAGFTADIFYKRLPIMADAENRFYKFSFYVSFQFGKRW